jgi:cell wall-associated NlpC family hydrolase
LASTGSTSLPRQFQVDNLQVISGSWASAPTVTHSTWVRVLPAPFDGTWNTALASQILTWAADTTPDVLAYAMMYITGAPAVTDAGLGGVQISGQSNYGPLSTAGVPVEGADFHDYLGMNWTFPNGETQTANGAELRCLDCSGFVRMIYGYRMGIPMVRDLNFDGLNLPRQTKDIGLSGPGIIVAQASGAAPPLTGLQIGDVPHFDADTTDPVAGQLDHNGIYLGLDTNNRPRFINSRKTPNGPTFGDLGGSSALDGTGTYATSLRLIRRF